MTRVHDVPDAAFRPFQPPNRCLRVHGGAVRLSLDGVRLLEHVRRTVLAERLDTLRDAIEDTGPGARALADDILRDVHELNQFWASRPFGGPYTVERAAEDAAAGNEVLVARNHASAMLSLAAQHPALAAIVAAFNDTKDD